MYKQLAKKEDMRQDAVMKQVFDLVNRLLTTCETTKVRALSIRTYKIIPLTRRTGILEWVNDTLPLGDYLTQGKHSAHIRLRPRDWTPMDCRQKLAKPPSGSSKSFSV